MSENNNASLKCQKIIVNHNITRSEYIWAKDSYRNNAIDYYDYNNAAIAYEISKKNFEICMKYKKILKNLDDIENKINKITDHK